ncbi:MAG: double-strand break repair protein AddB [Azospirillum sp.]|nr:double-strand break repair protein AddB [Azospirillum sp.]
MTAPAITAPAIPAAARVYTIPAGVPFVDALASGILDRVGHEPLALAGCTVLLPTRRACRSLREAFLRRADGKPLLLPMLSPLGDIDAEGIGLQEEALPGLTEALTLTPALSGLRRQLLLTRTILAMPDIGRTPAQAARLAADLARLLDEVQTERLGFDRLARLVPDEHAEHWQITLAFLGILTERWPELLAEQGAVDPAQRRNRLLAAQAALWRQLPPAGWVIAAGSTGSIPATADLLKVVAGLPLGAVVLPGLDQDSDDPSWQRLEETHPQWGLARLLRHLEIDRAAVRLWQAEAAPADPPGAGVTQAARRRLIAEALRPAATTEEWRALAGIEARALDGLTRLDCPGAREEAGVIALLMRQTLETPGKTAALITPDRALARRVAGALGRWGIATDDSGGVPLAETAVGSFLRLAAAAVAERYAPVPLLALLKHPLAAGGQAAAEFRASVRALERAVLRGPRPDQGITGLLAALAEVEDDRFDDDSARPRLILWVQGLERLLAPLDAALTVGGDLASLLRGHIAAVEALAASDDQGGANRLWRHDDGEAMAALVAELAAAAGDFPDVSGTDYPALFEVLLAGRVVRPRFGRHPRLTILGPLEARLLRADRVILGGLNEGTWPAEPPVDPWLSRPMRRDFGLPAPERQVGLAAHDFAQLAAAPEVILTRALRVDGTPTVPSRWLSRLDAVLRAAGLDGRIDQDTAHWLAWLRALDEPAAVTPIAPPEPRPPVAARPRQLSVTEIETWMRDPYAIYARHVLGLRALEPIAADPGALERGQFIHQALEAFVRAWPGAMPADALDALLGCGRAAFGDLLARPEVWAFWWPRFERIARWFVEFERGRRATIRPLATEAGGRIEFDGRAGPFRLIAKADRIDRLPDGGLMIIDYKTGAIPSPAEIALGFAPQLPLEAAIAETGGFGTALSGPVAALAFWRLGGGDPAGEEKPVKGDLAALTEQAHGGLERLIWVFDDPATPYRSQPRPSQAPRFSDYEHLARVQEWSAGRAPAEG